MISKELLSEVLGLINEDFEVTQVGGIMKHNNSLQYSTDKNFHYTLNKSINIYELAHKCKEWAYDEGYSLKSYRDGSFLTTEYYCMIGDNMICFEADTEPEAVFKACEWIMEN